MKVLITGAKGLVASYFVSMLEGDHQVAALGHGELDIADAAAVVDRAVGERRPDLIVNGAVLQVDDAEQDPARARAVNIEGPRHLAEAARQCGAELLHFSTQYVFDGEPPDRAPYTVDDTPRPVNNYGRSKLDGEAAVRGAWERSYIVRTSWVFGRGKNSFLCTAHGDLKAGKRLRVIDDIWSSTTFAADLVERCLEIVRRRHYGTYHVVNDGVCTYHDFALEAGRLAGLNRTEIDSLLEITHEKDMQRVAARPRYTPMRCLLSERLGLRPMRSWQEALAAYVRG